MMLRPNLLLLMDAYLIFSKIMPSSGVRHFIAAACGLLNDAYFLLILDDDPWVTIPEPSLDPNINKN